MSDLSTTVGAVALRSAILTAAGTSGYGDELAGYGDLRALGAVVVKSLAAFAWEGNPAPRVSHSGEHMLNAVGLEAPVWRRGARVIWRTGTARVRRRGVDLGRTAAEFAQAAEAMRGAHVVALEVNASCPNLESRSSIFAHSALATAAIVRASKSAELPLWISSVRTRRTSWRSPARRSTPAPTHWCSSTPCSDSPSTSNSDERLSVTVGAA